MDGRPVLVTGAAGFIGRHAVAALADRGVAVRAGVRHPERAGALAGPRVELAYLDLGDDGSIASAVRGVGTVFHFAGLVDARAPLARLCETNVLGTRRLCTAAAAAGVARLVHCSTTAVYGLAAAGGGPIAEDATPRALEPYGRTKLEGERAALDVARAHGMATVILRPAAVFGAGERTPLGRTLRRIGISRIVLPGTDEDWTFSYVHVDDVVKAALHVAEHPAGTGSVFNVAVEPPLRFAEAFAIYRRVLRRAGHHRWRERALAALSASAQSHAAWSQRLPAALRRRWLHGLWRPGWDLTYSAARLRATGFAFTRTDFAEVLDECLNGG